MTRSTGSRAPRGGEAASTGDDVYVALDRDGAYRVLAPQDRSSETQLRYAQAMDRYAGGRYGGSVMLVRSRTLVGTPRDLGWIGFAANVDVHDSPGDHTTIVTRHVDELARLIKRATERVAAFTG